MNSFEQKISNYLESDGLYSSNIDTIQVNAGLVCNQECVHCHVKASPFRTEIMEWPVMQKIIEAAQKALDSGDILVKNLNT